MVIRVDKDLCCGCMACCEALTTNAAIRDGVPCMPDLAFGGYFISDKWAYEMHDKIQQAYNSCPVNAITLEE